MLGRVKPNVMGVTHPTHKSVCQLVEFVVLLYMVQVDVVALFVLSYERVCQILILRTGEVGRAYNTLIVVTALNFTAAHWVHAV